MSTNYISQITASNGTTYDIQEGVTTRIFRATCTTAANTAAKVATLDDDTGYSLTAGVRIAVTFTNGNRTTSPTLNVNSGGAKFIYYRTDPSTAQTVDELCVWGANETVIFTYSGSSWIMMGSSLALYNAYNKAASSGSGTITEVKTNAGAHTTIDVLSGKAEFNVPTKTSHLTNDSGFVTTSHGHGDISNSGDCTTNTTIASGDRLMVNDESASRIRNSSITFGTSTSQYLSNQGTWESIPTELPASDVYSWAKEASKPSYTASEVGALSDSTSIPKKTSDLTNDSGFITGYTETDPVFSASAAAGITSTDISNWNAKVSDDKTWKNKTLSMATSSEAAEVYIPQFLSTDATGANLTKATSTPGNYYIAKYAYGGYLKSTTPSANDNSTKVATTAYVDRAIPTVPTKTSDLTNDSGFVTTDEKLKVTSTNNRTEYTLVTMPTSGSMPRTTTGNLCSEFAVETDGSSYSELYVGKKYRGQIKLGNMTNSSITYTNLKTSHTTERTITLPDKTGTVALTSDIPTVPTITLNGSSTTSPSFYAPTTAGTSGYYLKSNGSGAPTWVETITIEYDNGNDSFITKGAASIYGKEVELITNDNLDRYVTVPTITLNGSVTTRPSFYAPTTAGTSGYVLKSNGSGAPTWVSAALTDTKNTAGSTNSTSQLYLIGATSQAANPQTYSNVGLYFDNGLNSETSIVSDWQSSISQDPFNITLDVTGDNDYYISIDKDNGITIDGLMTPTQNTHAANKQYVDDALSSYSTATNWLNGSATGSVRTSGSDSNYTMGEHAVAEGYGTTASGSISHAEGAGSIASGSYSHAEGANTTASGRQSHAGGLQTVAQTRSQTAIGEYNILDTSGSTTTRGAYAFIIGNGTGTSNSSRSNALTVDWSGNLEIAGSLNDEALLSSATIAKWNTILGV